MTECKICHTKFKDNSILLSHINIHIGRKCKTCNQIFKTSKSNENHSAICMDSHKWLSEQSKRRKSIVNAEAMIDAANINSKTNELHCSFCSFTTSLGHRWLKIHMTTHENEKPYKCEECQENFIDQNSLNGHKLWVHKKRKTNNECNNNSPNKKRKLNNGNSNNSNHSKVDINNNNSKKDSAYNQNWLGPIMQQLQTKVNE
eukprot:467329_1